MTVISPSILSCDFLNIQKDLSHFNEVENLWFHLDIMDGHFVPNLTIGHPVIKLLSKITNQKLDAHLMVTNPDFYLNTFKDFNLHNFTFHFEATKSTEEVLGLISKYRKDYPSLGISIKPNTKVEDVPLEVLKKIDLLLVMSVEPGFGGQSFIEGTWDKLEKISQLKKENSLTFEVQIDGGVNGKNSHKLIEKGATNLVAGSYIFKAGPENYLTQIESLR